MELRFKLGGGGRGNLKLFVYSEWRGVINLTVQPKISSHFCVMEYPPPLCNRVRVSLTTKPTIIPFHLCSSCGKFNWVSPSLCIMIRGTYIHFLFNNHFFQKEFFSWCDKTSCSIIERKVGVYKEMVGQ